MFKNKENNLWMDSDLKHPVVIIIHWIFFISLVIVCLSTLLPILWVLLSGFKDTAEFYAVPPSLLPKSFDISKLWKIWKLMKFEKYYLNTLAMTLGNLCFCLVSCGLAGYVFSRLKPAGSKVMFRIVVWSLMIPASVATVPFFMSFVDFPYFHWNFSDTYVPMWIIAGSSVYYTLIFKTNYDDIPVSYIEAARIDGCGDLKIFTKIVMPMSLPVTMVIAMFVINASWSDFFYPYLFIKNSDMNPISVQLFGMVRGNLQIDEQILALFLGVLPPIIMFVFFQKYIMTGFSMSGIKE